MKTIRTIVRLTALLWLCACGGKRIPPAPYVPAPTQEGGPPSGADADVDAPDGDAEPEPPAACIDPEGPMIEFLSPEPGNDPNADPFLSSALVTVRCRITPPEGPSALPVDPSTVRILQLNEEGGVTAEGSASLDTPGEYIATFDVTGSSNGLVHFHCEAADVAETPRCNALAQTSILDLGPDIAIGSPADGTTHGDTMTVAYTIAASPVDEEDSLADLVSQELIAAGTSIPGVAEASPGSFAAVVDFGDTDVFPVELSGTFELRVTATNARGATRSASITFTVDSDGPSITIESPTAAQLVGGVTPVTARVTDPAGIDMVTITNRGVTEAMTLVAENQYRAMLDTAAIPSSITETLINVSATDAVGNTHTTGVTVKLDSVPPLVDLDPPDVRETVDNKCSALFDPVGSDSVNDGQVVGTAGEFRFRAHDFGNSSIGGSGVVSFLAGVDESSARLLILDDTSVPLIIDADGDGVCDSVNPEVEPVVGTGPQAVQWTFGAVPVQGEQFYPAGDMTAHEDPLVASLYDVVCTTPASEAPRDPVCGSSPLWRIIASPLAGHPPAIFGKMPIITGPDATCAGDSLDFQTSLDAGWACVVAVLDDMLGNRGISRPLRACFTADGATGAPCGALPGTDLSDSAELPDCTDGCSSPPSFADYPGHQLVDRN